MLRKKIFPIFFLLMSALTTLWSQAPAPSFVRDSLDAYVSRALTEWQIPGAAVCIVQNGQTVVCKGYGLRSLGKSERVDENTLFMIGSNTKAFTGTALAMLEQEGKCHIEDRVQRWLPDFTMHDPLAAASANLADLLSHRLGMETFQGDFMYWNSNLTARQVRDNFGKLPPTYPFRTVWGYCNAGYAIAGECIEKIGGLSWADFVRQRIFQPLGMSRSLALTAEMPRADNIATAHSLDLEGRLVAVPYCHVDHLAPAGSIASSVADMRRWMVALLDSGRIEGRRVIPQAAIARTRKPLSIQGRWNNFFHNGHFRLYGMGWDLRETHGREIVSHTGGVDGFVTSVTLLPEEKIGICVLTNTDDNNFYEALKWEILDAYLGLPYRNYTQIYLKNHRENMAAEQKQLAAWRDTIARGNTPPLSLDNFAGKYRHEIYGTISIERQGRTLVLRFEHHPELVGKAEYLAENRFLLSYNDQGFGCKPIDFQLDKGRVAGFTLATADFVEFTTYQFKKE